ncbi:MAG TPA: ABC transporter ATP-binding protein [Pyrinomonadaceae bacterium]|nr:ABC transporter ATP-binding protein [Pyrinomonadaceae bacterium]
MSTAVQQFHEEEALQKFDRGGARRLLRYLRPYKRLILPALLLTLLVNALGVLEPKFFQYAIDWYIDPNRPEVAALAADARVRGVALIALALLGVKLLQFAVSYFQTVLLQSVGQRVMYDLRAELYEKLQRQEVAYFDQNPVGRVMTRLTSDVDSLNELFTSGVIEGLGDVVMIFAIMGFMFWMDWRLTLVALVTVPLLFAATTWFRKHARRGYDLVRTKLARINSFLQEHISGAQTVQIFNREEKSLRFFAAVNGDHRRAHIETIFYYAVFFPLVDFIGSLGVALIIWYGGWRVMQNTPTNEVLSIGALVAFIQYSQRLFQPIRDISDKYNVFQAALVASHRIFRTLDRPLAVTTPAEPQRRGRARGRVEFRDVWFAYKEEEWVLKGVSFVIEPGQTVALVGHTGSGKTTITNLLMRFYDVQRGQILLDGVDVREWDLQSLRENFAVVLQDVFLFSGTVEGNIRLGREGITGERVRWAAREVHADRFVERLPGGYASEVRERGAGLSVGQKQLISFARALAFDPAILILDEATSSIDTETEQLIQRAIERVLRDRTSVVVAHRLSTVQRASRILVLHHGELREQGTHQELLALRGLYWRLYKLQYADDSRRDDAPADPALRDSLQFGD